MDFFMPPFSHRRLFEIGKFYRDRSLTECLEILEEWGFRGDAAILILAIIGGEA